MFTGIILETGVVKSVRRQGEGVRMSIVPRSRMALRRGESVAVDGVCLTVVGRRDGAFETDVSPETLSRTTLQDFEKGARVNLERPLRLNDRLGGHLVQGHVDGTGLLKSIEEQGEFVTCRWTYPSEFFELVVPKGSIAVNGVSLTIVDPDKTSFAAALIPETLKRTNLGRLEIGSAVNLEFDVIAKFVARLARPYLGVR